jgi:succinate dehydrogenase/fumarate reductase flavoprotein subunit
MVGRVAPVVVSDSTFELEADVVVVGGGAAGFSAALSAAAHGASVTLLEKMERVGGTTAKSGGIFWIANNHLLRGQGIEDPKADALKYMARLARPQMYDPSDRHLGLPAWEHELLECYYDRGSEAASFLVDSGRLVCAQADGFPDYYAHLPEDKVPRGRALQPLTDSGEIGSGETMIAQLRATAEHLGATVLEGHRVEQAIVDERGGVVGVCAVADQRAVRVRARRGIVFATGGFAHNDELRRSSLPGPVFGSCAARGATGDLIPIATALGAQLRNMNNATLSAQPIEIALSPSPNVQSYFQPPGESMLLVNRYGRRVVNEKLVYNELGRKFWEWDGRRGEYPNLALFMVWDQRCEDFLARWPLEFNPMRLDGSDRHVLRGDTLQQLADAIAERLARLAGALGGMRLDDSFGDALAATVARFNRFAATGEDPDFHRGETPIELFFNAQVGTQEDHAGRANPTMWPLATTGPYYATIIGPAVIDTKGGPKVNVHAQVLDAADAPIPGLYAAGNCAGSWSGQAYWGGGATIGPAVTFGYIAGAHAAGQAIGGGGRRAVPAPV